jgi:hypothetical protein
MQKFKKGELVTLSSAGMKNDHNIGYTTGFGIILQYIHHASFPYKMRWFSKSQPRFDFEAKEYELKRFKGKK